MIMCAKEKESLSVGPIPTNVDDGLLLSIIYSFMDSSRSISLSVASNNALLRIYT